MEIRLTTVPPDLRTVRGKKMMPAELYIGRVNVASLFWDEPRLKDKGLASMVINWTPEITAGERQAIMEICSTMTRVPLNEIQTAPWSPPPADSPES